METTSPPRPILGTPHRPYRRGVDNAVLGGVCGGMAIRLGVRERTIRVVFCLLALVSGVGLLLYLLLWLFLERAGEDHPIIRRVLGPRFELKRVLVGVVAIIGVIFLLAEVGIPNLGIYTWPLLLTFLGLLVVWRGASIEERHHLEDLVRSAPLIRVRTSKDTKSLWLRLILGFILVFFGLHELRHYGNRWGGATETLFGAVILLGGVFVILAPWWLSTLSDLSGERRERVRVEERAAVAAHLHDSVLQTLTLIERAAGDETAVTRLARNQERELRQWLFDPDHATTETARTFAAQLRTLEAEIENDYGVKVELVIVGDVDVNDDIAALLAAGREAAINAARWSGAQTVSIYGEVESNLVSLFVRDRGHGFDVDAVAEDRRGIALSIRQRMANHGGEGTVKSALFSGTEVSLSISRDDQ